MTEPATEKGVFAPTDTFWTRDLDGTLQMWTVDGTGKPLLMVAGDPPFPPPEGEPFKRSMMTQILRWAAVIFGAVSLVLILFGFATGTAFPTWAALVMFALIILVGLSHYHDKQRALRR